MLDKNLWLMRSARRDINFNVPTDEPSHIHIARPSRLRRRDTSGASVEPIDEIRDPAAPEVTVQAA